MMMGPSLPSVPRKRLTVSTLMSAFATCISSRRNFSVSAWMLLGNSAGNASKFEMTPWSWHDWRSDVSCTTCSHCRAAGGGDEVSAGVALAGDRDFPTYGCNLTLQPFPGVFSWIQSCLQVHFDLVIYSLSDHRLLLHDGSSDQQGVSVVQQFALQCL